MARILSERPSSRDSDNILLACVIKELLGSEIYHMSAKALVSQIIEGEFGVLETIGRTRRKIQEKNPSLRGVLWKARHEKIKNITNQLKFDF